MSSDFGKNLKNLQFQPDFEGNSSTLRLPTGTERPDFGGVTCSLDLPNGSSPRSLEPTIPCSRGEASSYDEESKDQDDSVQLTALFQLEIVQLMLYMREENL